MQEREEREKERDRDRESESLARLSSLKCERPSCTRGPLYIGMRHKAYVIRHKEACEAMKNTQRQRQRQRQRHRDIYTVIDTDTPTHRRTRKCCLPPAISALRRLQQIFTSIFTSCY
jgi:hypothetical protein